MVHTKSTKAAADFAQFIFVPVESCQCISLTTFKLTDIQKAVNWFRIRHKAAYLKMDKTANPGRGQPLWIFVQIMHLQYKEQE